MKKLIGCLVAMMLLGALVQMVDVQAATVLSTDDMDKITAGYSVPMYCGYGGSCGCSYYGCRDTRYKAGGTGRGQCKVTSDRNASCRGKTITCCVTLFFEYTNCQGEELKRLYETANSCD